MPTNNPSADILPTSAYQLASSSTITNLSLKQVLEQAPSFHEAVRQVLQTTFATDPEQMLLRFKREDGTLAFTRNLLQIAAQLQRQAQIAPAPGSLEADAVTAQVLARINHTVIGMLDLVKGIDLQNVLINASKNYWATMQAPARTRFHFTSQAWQSTFFATAQVNHVVGRLSTTGLQLALAIVEHPARLERQVQDQNIAKVQAQKLYVTTGSGDNVLLSSALVVGEPEGRQLLYIPGFAEQLYEYASLQKLSEALNVWFTSASRGELWHLLDFPTRNQLLLPVTRELALPFRYTCRTIAENPFEHSLLRTIRHDLRGALNAAQGLTYTVHAEEVLNLTGSDALQAATASEALRGRQWTGELPQALRLALSQRLDYEASQHSRDISFASLGIDVPERLSLQKLDVYRGAIRSFIELGSTAQADRQRYQTAYESWQATRHTTVLLTQGLLDAPQQLPEHFWTAQDENLQSRTQALVKARIDGLLQEARLLNFEKQLSDDEYTWLEAGTLGQVGATVSRLLVKANGERLELAGALVFTPALTASTSVGDTPALLYVPGLNGGLQRLRSLSELKARVASTLEQLKASALAQLLTGSKHSTLPAQMAADAIEVVYIPRQAISHSV